MNPVEYIKAILDYKIRKMIFKSDNHHVSKAVLVDTQYGRSD